MKQQATGTEALDSLLALVEKATHALERLQIEKAALSGQVCTHEAAAISAAATIAIRDKRIEELERSVAALRKDADWCRWFRTKYGVSTFFAHIEREYLSHRADPADGADITIGPVRSPHAAAASDTAPNA